MKQTSIPATKKSIATIFICWLLKTHSLDNDMKSGEV